MTTKPVIFNRCNHNVEVLPFDESKIEVLIAEHGEQQAIGYLKAMQDFKIGLELTISNPIHTNPQYLVRKLEMFIDYHSEIIGICRTVLDRQSFVNHLKADE